MNWVCYYYNNNIGNKWNSKKLLKVFIERGTKMRLIRKEEPSMDFEFQRNFMELSSQYKEVEEGDPRLLCQASWETVSYINEHLPEGLLWNNEDGFLIGSPDEEYDDSIKINDKGITYAICPDAYILLDDILPDAIEYGLRKVFGHATKLED